MVFSSLLRRGIPTNFSTKSRSLRKSTNCTSNSYCLDYHNLSIHTVSPIWYDISPSDLFEIPNPASAVSGCCSDMACSVAGITSDANVLTNQLRLFSQRHMLQYQEAIPCEQLVATLCDIKQAYTQFGGLFTWRQAHVLTVWRFVYDTSGTCSDNL